jgi:hypothetical protein
MVDEAGLEMLRRFAGLECPPDALIAWIMFVLVAFSYMEKCSFQSNGASEPLV